MASSAPETGSTKTDVPARKPLYEGSTQFRRWRFSRAQLREKREALNRAAVDAIKAAFESDSPGSSSSVSFLTADEELLLVKLYIGKVGQICGLFRFPEEVEATAVSYLKRFYLNNTVMDWHPKNVMLTALFLATKTTNNPISLESYTAHIPKTAPGDVLELEFLVAQSLNFEFTVWHAHRALWGVYLDLQNETNAEKEEIKRVYEEALMHVRASRLTDAELMYTPSQIAMGALWMASKEMAREYIRAKERTGEDESAGGSGIVGETAVERVVEATAEVIAMEGQEAEVEAVREVDRRLRVCKNPEKIVGSRAYVAKKAQEEARASAKRERKAAMARESLDREGDVFGSELNMEMDEE